MILRSGGARSAIKGDDGDDGVEGPPGFSNKLGFTNYVSSIPNLDTDRDWRMVAPADGWNDTGVIFRGFVTGIDDTHPVNRIQVDSTVILWKDGSNWGAYSVGTIDMAADDDLLVLSDLTLVSSMGALGPLSVGDDIELRYSPEGLTGADGASVAGPPGFSNKLGFTDFVGASSDLDIDREWTVPSADRVSSGWPDDIDFSGYLTSTSENHPVNRLTTDSVVTLWRSGQHWATYALTSVDTADEDDELVLVGNKESSVGDLGTYSIELRYTPPDATEELQEAIDALPDEVSSPPGDLDITPGPGELSVAWIAPNEGPIASGYTLEYRQGGSGAWTTVTLPISRNYTITGLTNGEEYEVRVRAFNVSGAGPWVLGVGTPEEEAAPIVPGVPTDLNVVGGERRIFVYWDVPETGAAADEYEVNWRTASGAWDGKFVTATRHTISILTSIISATTYTVRVSSWRDSRREQSAWVSADVVVSPSTAAPGVPQNLELIGQRSISGICALWEPPITGGGVRTFELRYKLASSSIWGTAITNIISLEYLIGDIAYGEEYDVQVRAKNNAGTSAWTDTASITPDEDLSAVYSADITIGGRTANLVSYVIRTRGYWIDARRLNGGTTLASPSVLSFGSYFTQGSITVNNPDTTITAVAGFYSVADSRNSSQLRNLTLVVSGALANNDNAFVTLGVTSDQSDFPGLVLNRDNASSFQHVSTDILGRTLIGDPTHYSVWKWNNQLLFPVNAPWWDFDDTIALTLSR